MIKEIYCNSCKYASENDAYGCEKYLSIPSTVSNGGVCFEYILHRNKTLSKELAEKIDLAISSKFDFTRDEVESLAKSVKHSQCIDCIKEISPYRCEFFGDKPHKYSSVLAGIPCPRKRITLESRIKGALYGFAIGDAMGATTEFMTCEEIKAEYGIVRDIIGGGWLCLNKGEITDDTQMTLCVCKALEMSIDNHCREDIHNVNFYQKCCEYFTEWYKSNPKDIGNCCRNIISTCEGHEYKEWVLRAKNPNSLGNGSLMRSMPLVLANENLETTLVQGRLTHNNVVCDECVEEYFYILKSCIDGEMEKIPLGYKLMSPTGHVENTCNNAMYWFFETENVEEAIVGAVNHGGDADTIAAITGSLVGAYYGYYAIPTRWVYDLDNGVKKQLDHYAKFFTEIYEGKDYERIRGF